MVTHGWDITRAVVEVLARYVWWISAMKENRKAAQCWWPSSASTSWKCCSFKFEHHSLLCFFFVSRPRSAHFLHSPACVSITRAAIHISHLAYRWSLDRISFKSPPELWMKLSSSELLLHLKALWVINTGIIPMRPQGQVDPQLNDDGDLLFSITLSSDKSWGGVYCMCV